ncbi:MAG TPA: thioesterase family protein [Rhizomicrobium sp.]|nr:thioesterase family protein [Rhizomicrobium sp.]
MTSFSELMSSLTEDGDKYRITISNNWLQGRTTYGGLSAALCTEAALRAVPDLPPLRSAQFAFIGPASGPLSISTSVLRRGKSAVFVGVDLVGDAGLATRAILSFGIARDSKLAYLDVPMAKVSSPADSEPFFPGDRPTISFQQHFESRKGGGARPFSPGASPEYRIWFRHRDERARNGIVPLIALADAPPPASMVMFPQPAPISTMTWSLDVLSDNPATTDGWWLVQSRAEAAMHGYSPQTMTVWNSSGKAVIAARQNVAIFL